MRRASHVVLMFFALVLAAGRAPGAERAPRTPDVVALTGQVRNSLVTIRQAGRDGRQGGVGAGFVLSADGQIATCLHVIGEGRPLTVELAGGRRLPVVEVVASDRALDLAILRVAASNLPALKLGDSDALKQGAPVIALGNPAGLEHSVVQGVVSAKRDFDGLEMLQLAIPIEPGNSGGPLLDARGRVQGLLSMKSAVTANLGFAIPVNALQRLITRPNPVSIDRWLTLGRPDPAEWQPLMGARWTRKAGRLAVEAPGDGFGGRSLCLWLKPVPQPPYEVAVTVKLDDEAGAAGLAFASDGADRHYGFYPTAGQLRLTRFDGPDVFSWHILKEVRTAHYLPGDWNHLRVRVETNRIIGFVNGEQVLEVEGESPREGRVGLAKFRDTRAEFRGFAAGRNVPIPAPAAESPAFAMPDLAGRSDAEVVGEIARREGAVAGLQARAQSLDKEARRLRRLAQIVHARRVEQELARVLDRPEADIDLFHAALLVAHLDNPELEVAAYRDEVARLGAELRQRVPAGASESNKMAALNRFLFQERGFHGSRSDYYNRANSYMSAVLDDREGLPITLSVLWLELARAIQLTNVAGAPVPTRFMVRFAPRHGPEQIIDVFDGGRILTRSAAVDLVADDVDAIDETAFQPATKRGIVLRMLNNLLGIARREGGPADALRYLDAILALQPDATAERLQRARLHMQQGDNAAARDDLRWLIDHQAEGMDLERLGALFRSL